MNDRFDQNVDRLRRSGERVTPARRAVIQVLQDANGHLDADSITASVAAIEPGVHRATVYRTLQSLCELGLLGHTHVPGSATIYHLNDASHVAHAHMRCVHCQRVFDLPTAWMQPLAEHVEQATGFVIDPQHAALLGSCADCRHADD